MSHPDTTKEYHEPTKETSMVCELCGKHEAIPEYFEDHMAQYCTTFDTFVDLEEKHEYLAQQEELADQESVAFDVDNRVK